MQTLRNSRAFTIVELLVVVVVIAILASIIIVSYNGVQKSAISASVQSDLRSAATAIAVEINRSNSASVTGFPSTVKTSPKVGLSLATPASGSSYCINGAYAGSPSVKYYFDSVAGLKEGNCPGAHIVGTVIGDGNADPSGTGEQPGYTPPVIPQPVVLVSDNFNRSNSTNNIGSAQTGQAWTSLNGTWGISSNQAYASTNGDGNLVAIAATEPATEVSARFSGMVNGHYPGLIARAENTTKFYVVEVSGENGHLWLYGSANDPLGESSNGTVANGDLVTLRTETLSGATRVTVLRNGTQLFQYTDSASDRPAGNYYGLRNGVVSGTPGSLRFDDFELKTFVN